MAEQAIDNLEQDGAEAPPSYPPIGPDAPWSQVWQLPALLLGLGLLALGVYVAMPASEPSDFDGALDSVAKYLQADNLEEAKAKLFEVQEQIDKSDKEHMGRMYAYFGDLNFAQLHHKDTSYFEQDKVQTVGQQIVRYYRSAEDEYDHELSNTQLARLAESLIELGRHDEALAVVDRLPQKPVADRRQLIRQMIEQRVAAADSVADEELTRLIDRYKEELRHESDPAELRRQNIWVTALQARLRLEADPNLAIDFLNQHIMLLQRNGQDDLAPLYVMLAKAYHRLERFDRAEHYYQVAQDRLNNPSDGLNAQIYVGKAQIRLSRGPTADETIDDALHLALHLFKKAVDEFPNEPVYIDALIGQADVEARLTQFTLANEHFSLAIEALRPLPANDARRQRITDIMLAHATHAGEQGDFDLALTLLTTLQPLFGKDLPADMLMRLALVHEQIADRQLEMVQGRPGAPEPTLEAQRLSNQEAAIHFGYAADYYRAYANLVTISRDHEHGDALWKAADNYDRAQLWDKAIGVYAEFVKTRLNDDRQIEAKFLLARSYMSAGDYKAAISHFQDLIRDQPNGRWAHESLVPLARAFAASEQFSQARATLQQATSDHPAITPDSEAYREALIELGKLHFRMGRDDPSSYISAIETLTECVQRFGSTPEGPMLRYLLAESNRLSVRSLDEKLQQRRAQRETIALQAERLRRLEEAQIYYNQVITELEQRDEERLTQIELTQLRNAYFYQADCAYDRARYQQAIDLYDEAAKRWERHPASLVAYVQIVNAYCELGDYRQAKLANEKALWQLERLPEEVFQDPTLPMTRRHWEDWLRWTSDLDIFGSQASAR